MRARYQSSIFSTGGKFCPDYGLLLELHALTLVARSYALLSEAIESPLQICKLACILACTKLVPSFKLTPFSINCAWRAKTQISSSNCTYHLSDQWPASCKHSCWSTEYQPLCFLSCCISLWFQCMQSS